MEPSAAPHADLRLHQRTRRLWVAKLSLRGTSLVLCLPLIAISAAIFHVRSMAGVFFLPQACLVLSWDAAEMATLVARRRPGYRGIHPGACVGVDLVLWLGLVAGVVLTAPSIGPYTLQMLTASLAFGILVTLVQIALFIIACIETHRRNSSESAQFNATWPAAMQQGTLQAGTPGMEGPVRCPTCPPDMSCPKCAPAGYPTPSPGAGYPPATGWQYKPELPAQKSAPYPGAPPAQHEMPASPPAGPPLCEMWAGNAPRHEMPAQNAGQGARQELPPQ